MAFSPAEYCRLFAQKKAYQEGGGGVTGTPGPPLATPLRSKEENRHRTEQSLVVFVSKKCWWYEETEERLLPHSAPVSTCTQWKKLKAWQCTISNKSQLYFVIRSVSVLLLKKMQEPSIKHLAFSPGGYYASSSIFIILYTKRKPNSIVNLCMTDVFFTTGIV